MVIAGLFVEWFYRTLVFLFPSLERNNSFEELFIYYYRILAADDKTGFKRCSRLVWRLVVDMRLLFGSNEFLTVFFRLTEAKLDCFYVNGA